MQDPHSLIVFPLDPLAELAGGAENLLDERARVEIGMAGCADSFGGALEAENLAAGIAGFDDPVGAQDNAVAALLEGLEDFVGSGFPSPRGKASRQISLTVSVARL